MGRKESNQTKQTNSQKGQKLFFKTNYGLMQVKSVAECSRGSILQHFRPSLSYHLSLRSLFCLFLSGRLRQVLLYFISGSRWYRVDTESSEREKSKNDQTG